MFRVEGADEPVGSINVSELTDDEKTRLGYPTETEAEAAEPEAEDLSKLLKADLVERAENAGVDTDGLTKAELIEALESKED